MGVAVGDATGDGTLDLVTTNFSEDFSTIYRGLGGGPFEDASEEAGIGPATFLPMSWGAAFADFDNDGDLDILITNLDAPPDLLRNDGRGAGSWLEVACEVPGGTAIPIGTTVTVTAGGRTQRRDIASGDSYLSTHDPRLHFGLGDAATVETIDVRWPDGSHTLRRIEPARRLITIRKGP